MREVHAHSYEDKTSHWLVVDQAPGAQLVFYRRLKPNSSSWDEGLRDSGPVVAYELPMPWTRLVHKTNLAAVKAKAPTHAMFYVAFDNESYDPTSGAPTGFEPPLPCVTNYWSVCGTYFDCDFRDSIEERASKLIDLCWGANFRNHITQTTWGNAFWESFGVDPPKSSYYADSDEAITEVFKRWSKTKLSEIQAKDLGKRAPVPNPGFLYREYIRPKNWKPTHDTDQNSAVANSTGL